MGIFERIRSAVAGAIPVEDDLDMENSQRVRNLPQSSDPNDAVPESEAQAKADAAENAAESYADGEIESHRQNETHSTPQPPQSHGNGAHVEDYVTASDVSISPASGAVTNVGSATSSYTYNGSGIEFHMIEIYVDEFSSSSRSTSLELNGTTIYFASNEEMAGTARPRALVTVPLGDGDTITKVTNEADYVSKWNAVEFTF